MAAGGAVRHMMGHHEQLTHGHGGSGQHWPKMSEARAPSPYGNGTPGPDPSVGFGGDTIPVAGPDSDLFADWARYNPGSSDPWYPEDVRADLKDQVADQVGGLLDSQLSEADIQRGAFGQQLLYDWGNYYGDGQETPGYTVAARMHDQWAETSGDHTPAALELQRAAALELGLEGTANPYQTYGADEGAHYGPHDEELLRTYARAEYENTQAMLEQRGVTEITVYRGVGDSVQGGGEPWDGSREVDITSNPLSSWSTSPFTAASFALDSKAPAAYVMSMKVPASRVWSTARSGAGCLAEEEVILLGGPKDRVTAWRVNL